MTDLLTWLLFAFIAFGVIGQQITMIALAGRAQLADRLIAATGGQRQALALLEQLERQNDERLAGALSINLFTNKDKRT